MSFPTIPRLWQPLRRLYRVCRVSKSTSSNCRYQLKVVFQRCHPAVRQTACVVIPTTSFHSQARAAVSDDQSRDDATAEVQASPRALGYPWRIVAAVCVQRFPKLSREKTDLEQQYEEMIDTVRAERSRLSDFELEEKEQLRQKRERERRALEEDLDSYQDSGSLESSNAFEELQEAMESELEAFQPGLRESKADLTDNRQSMERSLDRVLYLLVKKPEGASEHTWQMPQGGVMEEETIAKTAKRELCEECGPALKVDFISNTPSAYFSYKYTSPSPTSIIGSKVFFLKAQYRGGEVELDHRELEDYAWVTREEMKTYVEEDYYAAVVPMLFD